MHNILTELDTNNNGQIELAEYLQVIFAGVIVGEHEKSGWVNGDELFT